ncbi:hypothetical protein D917_09448, partial [Trichinella nativa]
KHLWERTPDRPCLRLWAKRKLCGGELPAGHEGRSLLHPEGRGKNPRPQRAPLALSLHGTGRSCGARVPMAQSGIPAWSGGKLKPTGRKHHGEGACDPSGLWKGPTRAGGVLGWDTGKNQRSVGQWPWRPALGGLRAGEPPEDGARRIVWKSPCWEGRRLRGSGASTMES